MPFPKADAKQSSNSIVSCNFVLRVLSFSFVFKSISPQFQQRGSAKGVQAFTPWRYMAFEIDMFFFLQGMHRKRIFVPEIVLEDGVNSATLGEPALHHMFLGRKRHVFFVVLSLAKHAFLHFHIWHAANLG